MTKLSYCIIKGDGINDAYTIYALLPETGMPHPSIVNEESFSEFKELMDKHGFLLTPLMTFRIGKKNKLKIRALHTDLSDHGFERKKEIEKTLKQHLLIEKATNDVFDQFFPSSAITRTFDTLPTFSDQNIGVYVPTPYHASVPIKDFSNMPIKNRIIDIGESMTLNVYLFIRTVPTEDDTIEFDFEFDFFSRSNSETRRFVKIIECEFVRIDQGTSQIMYLESVKTLMDIIRELDFLFTMRIGNPNEVLSGAKPDLITYNAVEIKDFINLNGKVSLCIDVLKSYDEIIRLSESIEREKVEDEHGATFILSLVKKEAHKLSEKIEKRMLYYSENEYYELAAAYKKNHDFVNEKMKKIDLLLEDGKKIVNLTDYEENFTLKDFCLD